MTATPGEKIDPGHWIGLCGGALMFLVVLLCSAGLMFPWWTEHNADMPGQLQDTEVSLWILYTRTELSADVTENCEAQCDYTKVGTSKVRETRIGWSDYCSEAPAENAGNCQQIWILRAGAMLCFFLALISSALATFNFCGAGLPASIRCAPTIKLVLGVGCVVSSTMALCVAAVMDVRYQPTSPGTAPRDHPAPQNVPANGLGFWCVLTSCIASVIGSGISYLAQQVVAHLEATHPDEERGRPLADVNRGKAPNLFHQVQVAPKEIKPPPRSTRPSRWESKNPAPAPVGGQDSKDPAPVKVGGWVQPA